MCTNHHRSLLCSHYMSVHLLKIITILFIIFSSVLRISNSQTPPITRRRTSNVCREHMECPRNAFCDKTPGISNGQCICHQGFIIIANEVGRRDCYKSANSIGDSCTYHEQCWITLSTESECYQGRCECKNGTHFVERKNTCYRSVRVGDFCTYSSNCLGKDTFCQSGTCHCPYGKHPRNDMLDCIPNVYYGEKCISTEECVTGNSRCFEDTCQCKASHVINKEKNVCLPMSKNLHDPCDEDLQCSEIIPNSICDLKNLTCVCKKGFHEINYVSIILEDLTFIQQMKLTVSLPLQRCWVSVPLGGICEVDENCASIENSICFENRCICHDGLKAIADKCSLGHSLNSFLFPNSQRNLIMLTFVFTYLFYFI